MSKFQNSNNENPTLSGKKEVKANLKKGHGFTRITKEEIRKERPGFIEVAKFAL